jgi:hypothetical protein
MIALIPLLGLVLLFAVGTPVEVIVGLAVAGVLWWVSVLVWPEKMCRACRGAGHRSGFANWTRGCGECQGTGRVPRIGARQ